VKILYQASWFRFEYKYRFFNFGGSKDQLSQYSEEDLKKLDTEIAAEKEKFSSKPKETLQVSLELSQHTQTVISEARLNAKGETSFEDQLRERQDRARKLNALAKQGPTANMN
jgi:hypothetical protein